MGNSVGTSTGEGSMMTTSAPIVSIIIPAFNAAAFLGEAIASVQQQTFTQWELLIIDDGSTDTTAIIAEQAQKSDRRIHLMRQPNAGASTARNHGIASSHGAFIAFLDADDRWKAEKLEIHWEAFQSKPELDISFAQVEFLDLSGQPMGQFSKGACTDLRPELFLSENPTSTPSTWVVRRSVFEQVGGFCETLRHDEDLEWLIRASCTDSIWIEGIDQVLTGYRINPKGLSADLYRMEEGWQMLVHQVRSYAPDLVHQHYAQAQAVHLRYLARHAFRLRLPPKIGIDFMTRAVRSNPRILLTQPKRTFLTMLAVYGRGLFNFP
jgi:glycosyltransferase involved in cell wall biosynthesis